MEYRQYITSTNEEQRAAFLNGARAMMTALSYHDADGIRRALCQKNDQHIIALLAGSEKLETAQRRQDAINLLELHHVDWNQFHAFVFDHSYIDYNGCAMDGNGMHIEDDMFRPVDPTQPEDYWPNFQIYGYTEKGSRQQIGRVKYRMLDTQERSKYDYIRFLNLQGFTLKTNDACCMEELIRQDILQDNPDINRRYLVSIGRSKEGLLRPYRKVIISTLSELSNNPEARTFVPPMILAQAEQGNIQSAGQLLLAYCQAFIYSGTRKNIYRLDINKLARIATLITDFHTSGASQLITDKDISEYLDINQRPLRGAIKLQDSETWQKIDGFDQDNNLDAQKNYLRHILVPRLISKLLCLLDHRLTSAEVNTIMTDTVEAISHNLAPALLQLDINANCEFQKQENAYEALQTFFEDILAKAR